MKIDGVNHLNNIQVQNHVDCCTNLVLKSMHFETHGFENDLRTSDERDLLEKFCNLCSIQRRRGKQNIELDR